MAATAVNPAVEIKVQRTMTDLATFTDVRLVKLGKSTPITDFSQLVERCGGNTDKALAVVNEGLRIEDRKNLAKDTTVPWNVVDEDGEVSGEFTGQVADSAKVSKLVMTFASTSFGYVPKGDKAANKAAKAAAVDFIRNTQAILDQLQKSGGESDE